MDWIDFRPESMLLPGERVEVTAEANTVIATFHGYGGGLATFKAQDGNVVLLTDRRMALAEVGLSNYAVRGSVAFPRSEVRVLSYERTQMLRELQLRLPDREEPVRLRFANPFLAEAHVLADQLGWEAPATSGLKVGDPLLGVFLALGALLMLVVVLGGPGLSPVIVVLGPIAVVVGAVAFGRRL